MFANQAGNFAKLLSFQTLVFIFLLFLALNHASSFYSSPLILAQDTYRTVGSETAPQPQSHTSFSTIQQAHLYLGSLREAPRAIPEQTFAVTRWVWSSLYQNGDSTRFHQTTAFWQANDSSPSALRLLWATAVTGSQSHNEWYRLVPSGVNTQIEFLNQMYGRGEESIPFATVYTEELLPFIARSLGPDEVGIQEFMVLPSLAEGSFVKRYYRTKAEVLPQRLLINDVETYLVRFTREDDRIAEFWVSWQGNRRIIQMRSFMGVWHYFKP
jgi:hypothetical protein